MLAAADKLHLLTTDERLRRGCSTSDPQFASLRNPDGSVNRDTLTGAAACRPRCSPSGCARSSRAPGDAAASAAGDRAGRRRLGALDAMSSSARCRSQRFDAKDTLAKVDPERCRGRGLLQGPGERAQFQAPEQASIEYVVLDLEAVKKGVTVAEDDLRKYYAENEKRYTAPEERRASHILVKADKDAPQAERDKAKAKAEALLAEVRKNPAAFAELAKQELRRPGLRGEGRRPRLLRPRRDGQAVRGRRVRA